MPKGETEEIVTKGEFARRCKVSPGRVSQWIADGQITPAALDGQGRSAKVRVAQAQADLKRNLDPAQMTGNGVRTRIPGGPLTPPPPEPPAPRARLVMQIEPADEPEAVQGDGLDPVREKALLTREQRENWRMRNDERRGVLIEAAEAERQWGEIMVEIRSTILGVAGKLPALLPHLAPADLAVIDRAYRDGLNRAAGGGA